MNAPSPTVTDAPARPTDLPPTRCLDLLGNDTTQRVLTALGEEPLTASELADRTNLPASTLYRQLSELKETCFVEESVRVQPGGHHAAQYARAAREIVISVADDIAVSVTAR